MVNLDNIFFRVFHAALLATILVFSGCAASTQYGAATVTTNPAGAEVINLKDDSSLGTTPVRVSFSGSSGTAELITIQLRKKGYADRITSFWINRRHDSASLAKENAIDLHVDLEKEASDQ